MTGRDLIIYILENNLEDEPVFEDDNFIGFMSVEEVALHFNVGTETIKIWIELGGIPGFEFNNKIYIPANIVK